MNEKHITQFCIVMSILSIFLLIPFSTEFFNEKTIGELLEKEGNKGLVFGRIEYIISARSPTIFILNDGNKSKVFAPNTIDLNANNFVSVYGETKTYKGEKEIFAYYVVVE